jgi:putative membrane protein
VSTAGAETHLASMGLVACVLLALLFWVLSTGEVMLRLGRFEVRRTTEQIRVGRGLVSRKEVSLPADRIQALRVVESPGMLVAGFLAVYAEAVGHLEERRESTCLHPALRRDELGPFLQELLPEFVGRAELTGPPPRARVRFVWKPVAVFVGLAVAAYAWEPLLSIVFLLTVPLAIVAALRAYRDTGLGYRSELLSMRSRWLGRVSVVVPRRRIQAVWTSANWFQRRRSLASARVIVASGPLGRTFTARDLDEKVAADLLAWMGPRPGSSPVTALPPGL